MRLDKCRAEIATPIIRSVEDGALDAREFVLKPLGRYLFAQFSVW